MKDQKEKQYIVYFLASSANPHVPMYVGQTCKPLSKRLSAHISDSKRRSNKVTRWILSVIESGHKVTINPVAGGVTSLKESREQEGALIRFYQQHDFELMNTTPDGGKGRPKGANLGNNFRQKKAVNQYDLNGDFIATYPSAYHAQWTTGVLQGNISGCCNGRIKTSGGFIWRFATNTLQVKQAA